MNIPRGRMWAFCIGKDDKTLGCAAMFRPVSTFDHTLVQASFCGSYDLTTWSQEDRAAYLDGYNTTNKENVR